MSMNPIEMTLCWAFAALPFALAAAQESAATARSPISVEQRFKQWDKNGDGKLTPDEAPGENIFNLLDKNGDGVVTKEEANALGGGGRHG